MNLDKDTAWSIFGRMLLIRSVEETIAAHYGAQQMRCPTHLSSGQEGTPGVLSALLTDHDYAVSTHRGHAQGGNLWRRRRIARDPTGLWWLEIDGGRAREANQPAW